MLFSAISCIVALSFTGSPIMWHEAGHRAVGAIAAGDLTPKTKTIVDDLLRSLPDPHTPKSSVVPPDPFHELPVGFHQSGSASLIPATLEVAADWPDKARKTWLDRPNWHFINFSVNGPGGHAAPLIGGKAVDAIVKLISVARDTTLPNSTRAIAIAWIAHLVGDIHQPLHAVAYFDNAHTASDGDRGGNKYLLDGSGKPTDKPNLHSFWDGVVGEGPSDIPALLARISVLPAPPSSQTAITLAGMQATVMSWAHESVAIAKESVYRLDSHGKPKLSAKAALFSSASQPGARAVADARVQLAGFRLAELLNAAFE